MKELKNYFDPLNIYCSTNIYETEAILNGRTFYFYELGNINAYPNNIGINLCVLGRPGTGKST